MTDDFLLRPKTKAFEQLVERRYYARIDRIMRRGGYPPDRDSTEARRIRELADRDAREQLARELHAIDQRFAGQLASARYDTLNAHLFEVAQILGLTVVYHVGPGVDGFAEVSLDRVQVGFARSDAHYAVGLHEVAHCANGRCPGRPSHHDFIDGRHHRCLKCESNAWSTAQLLALDWSASMQEKARRDLASYAGTTPGLVDAHEAVAHATSSLALLERRTRRLRRDAWVERDTYARRITPWRFEGITK